MRWIAASAPARSSISCSRAGHSFAGEDRLRVGRAGQRLDHGPARPEHLVIDAMGDHGRDRHPGLGGRREQRRLRRRLDEFPSLARDLHARALPASGCRNANVSREAPLLSRRSSPVSGSPSTSPRRSAIARVRAFASATPLSTQRLSHVSSRCVLAAPATSRPTRLICYAAATTGSRPSRPRRDRSRTVFKPPSRTPLSYANTVDVQVTDLLTRHLCLCGARRRLRRSDEYDASSHNDDNETDADHHSDHDADNSCAGAGHADQSQRQTDDARENDDRSDQPRDGRRYVDLAGYAPQSPRKGSCVRPTPRANARERSGKRSNEHVRVA